MIVLPSMVGNVRASSIIFKISLMFLSSGFKTSGILPNLSAQTIIPNRYQDNTLSYCNSYFVRFCPFLAFLHFYCILVFNLFTPSLAYISNLSYPGYSSIFKLVSVSDTSALNLVV